MNESPGNWSPRERLAEEIVRALHADFTTYNKAKVMLLLQPFFQSMLWPEPWQSEINKVATERDALKLALAECENRPDSQYGAKGSGNYIADKEINPTSIWFANGRHVKIVGDHLEVGWGKPSKGKR